MRFAHAVSTAADTVEAARAAADAIAQDLGATPDLVMLFCTFHHADAADDLRATVIDRLAPGALVGCTAEGVFGGGREVFDEPAVALLGAVLPEVEATVLVLDPASLAGDDPVAALRRAGLPAGEEPRSLVLLADPFGLPIDRLLDAVNEVCRGWSVTGGMASGSSALGGSRLFTGDTVRTDGAVAVVLGGNLRTRTLVSQGCRPVGRPFVITAAEQNVVRALGGRTPLQCVREVFASEPPDVQELMSKGLMIGRVIDEHCESFRRGDFLVRAVMGFEGETGALVAGDIFRRGQTVQLHVRDRATADEDLAQLLRIVTMADPPPVGGLCFSCNGRGPRMFETPGHESAAIFGALGRFPMAGHFAAGEFGVIGGKAFIHGHTLSLALFGPRA